MIISHIDLLEPIKPSPSGHATRFPHVAWRQPKDPYAASFWTRVMKLRLRTEISTSRLNRQDWKSNGWCPGSRSLWALGELLHRQALVSEPSQRQSTGGNGLDHTMDICTGCIKVFRRQRAAVHLNSGSLNEHMWLPSVLVFLFIINELGVCNNSTSTSLFQGPHPSIESCSTVPSTYISFSSALLHLDVVQGIKKHAELFVLLFGTQVLRDIAKSTVVITMSSKRVVLA